MMITRFQSSPCPSLTTIAQDYEAIANRAVRELFGLLENEERVSERVQKPHLQAD